MEQQRSMDVFAMATELPANLQIYIETAWSYAAAADAAADEMPASF